ncbi:hypothetical protein [Pseudoalteromonas piscicida]|nr:hypothetical protein [Pseudoalteromonas piscicida]
MKISLKLLILSNLMVALMVFFFTAAFDRRQDKEGAVLDKEKQELPQPLGLNKNLIGHDFDIEAIGDEVAKVNTDEGRCEPLVDAEVNKQADNEQIDRFYNWFSSVKKRLDNINQIKYPSDVLIIARGIMAENDSDHDAALSKEELSSIGYLYVMNREAFEGEQEALATTDSQVTLYLSDVELMLTDLFYISDANQDGVLNSDELDFFKRSLYPEEIEYIMMFNKLLTAMSAYQSGLP